MFLSNVYFTYKVGNGFDYEIYTLNPLKREGN